MAATREHLRWELDGARLRFHAALAALPAGVWRAASANPGWTNGEVCFHVFIGFALVPPLLWLVRWMSRLPEWCDRGFARLLDGGTPLFDRVNALGPRMGARVLSREALGRRFDRAHARILRRLATMSEADLARAMHYPTRWDPRRFRAVMTAADVVYYPVAHMAHHLGQLSAGRDGSDRPAAGGARG